MVLVVHIEATGIDDDNIINLPFNILECSVLFLNKRSKGNQNLFKISDTNKMDQQDKLEAY